jgi:hypothetical protein
MPIRGLDGYGAREAYIDVELLTQQMRRRLLKANDEHGNKVLRKEILDAFGEIQRFATSRFLRAGVIHASDIDAGNSGGKTTG